MAVFLLHWSVVFFFLWRVLLWHPAVACVRYGGVYPLYLLWKRYGSS